MMNYKRLLAAIIVACCGDLNAQGVVKMASRQPAKTVVERSVLASQQSWSDGQETVLTPASTGTSSKRDMIRTRAVYYNSQTVGLMLVLMSDQVNTYMVQGGQSFYVFREGDVLSALVSAGGLILRNSLFKLSVEAGGDSATLARFVAEIDDAKLLVLSRQSSRIDLTPGVPSSYWTARGGLDQQAAPPAIVEIDLTGNNLRLVLDGAGGRQRGTFWIDIARKVITKTEIDGNVVFVESDSVVFRE